MTDDQDYLLGSTDAKWMPSLDKYLRKQGMELPNFVTSVASCCPSRTSFFTGKYCHTTNITSNGNLRGSVTKMMGQDLDHDYLPLWLQGAGYNTYMVGKFLNGFTYKAVKKLGCPKGWTVADPLIQDFVSDEEYEFSEDYPRAPNYMTNCEGEVQTFLGEYHEEVIRHKALTYLDAGAASGKPFFLYVSTVAPHDAKGAGAYPQVPPAYRDLFPGVKAPRTGNWGKPVPSTIGFSKQTPDDFNATDIDGRYRARLQSLRAVDDTIDAIMKRLACHGLLDNTVLMYTSDNGFKLGNHNMAQEKFTYFEEDVRVPFLMAGPGVPRGVYVPEVAAAMTDLTATIAHLAGAATGNISVDGAPLPLGRIAAAYPSPNQPGAPANPVRPVCPGLPPPSPSPPPSPPSPAPPGGKRGKVPKAPRPPQPLGRPSKRGLLMGSLYDAGADEALEAAADGPGDGSSGMDFAVRASSGRSLLQVAAGPASAPAGQPFYGNWSNVQLIEAWLDGSMSNLAGKDYRVLRVCTPFQAFGAPTEPRSGDHTCYKYIVLCNPRNLPSLGAVRQLFDLGRDPVELQDKFTQYKAPYNGIFKRLYDRLDAVLTVMSYCSGATCRNPFIAIHPDGSVTNLEQAMDARFDDLYGGFKKLSFKRCANYYHPENEIADLRLVPAEYRKWLA
ncbi:hypothetical protein HYH02_010226 [Chlamydomonas schloesseri]|uniref:Sulfatase N-terminal domain-containing protein n=1 Tax=Chlamydomonas schloesseri TaxID=2026947 RepID=A0A835T826_9CHLO|nr:hypothetical protein HYH02_010226 [Chlamydomonas schloesseri]|eukprot:KAG2440647.1 hypothetical protein HYH02_010226 [Chlamydomonas schloesseri]